MVQHENDLYPIERHAWYLNPTFYIGVLSLVVSFCIWSNVLHILRDLLTLKTVPLRWNFFLAGRLLGELSVVATAVGLPLNGIGLLWGKRRLIALGLIVMAPVAIQHLLLIPLHPGSHRWGLLIVSICAVVYFWWVWRTYRRMPAREGQHMFPSE